MVYRLALPVLLLLLLVGLTFWGDHVSRVETTITILLATSALYIVIFSSTPMLGYLTVFDSYIIWMFLMIVVVIFMHSINYRLIEKSKEFPLRLLLTRLIELMGKAVIMPLTYAVFIITFPTFGSPAMNGVIMALFVVIFSIVSVQCIHGVRKSSKQAIVEIRAKVDNPAQHDLRSLEVLFYNVLEFGKFSSSASHYHRWKKNVNKNFTKEVEMEVVTHRGSIEGLTTSSDLDNLRESFNNPMSAAHRGSIEGLTTSGDLDNLRESVKLPSTVVSAMHRSEL